MSGTTPSGDARPGRSRSADKADLVPGRLRGAVSWLRALVIAALVVSLLQTYVGQLARVKGVSMQPTLYGSDWLIADKLAYRFGHPVRGDVVILKDPSEDAGKKKLLVKRVVGVPGDSLETRGGVLYVNGVPEREPYTDAPIEDGDMGPIELAEGHYFVMGDNRHRGASKDSRSFGDVTERQIKARAELVVWPVGRWRKL